MEFRVYEGEEDAYWWLICIDKYFAAKNTPETEKLAEVVTVLRGCAHQWWFWWHHRHPHASWQSFVTAFLWHFKPEYRDILPIPDEEEEHDIQSMSLTVQGSFDVQQGTNPGNNVQIEMEKDMEKIQSENEGKRNEGSMAEPLKECLKETREISDIEGKMAVIDQDVKEEVKVEDAEKMKEFLAVNHSVRPIIVALPSPFSTIISGSCCWDSNNHFEEGGQGLLMEKGGGSIVRYRTPKAISYRILVVYLIY
ncbi:uncharacterized protein [Medicago truncatula]|uniref:uncharacterized protein n=1 Tax=Medicago truncatula TaxID=3880 RepID=UPI0019689125|nr:uncharacterized protein LOC120577170 [Medicago truncatula]